MCLFLGLLFPCLEAPLEDCSRRGDSGSGDCVKRGGETVTWGPVVVGGERADGDRGLKFVSGLATGGVEGELCSVSWGM
jgi:hypothetical protein